MTGKNHSTVRWLVQFYQTLKYFEIRQIGYRLLFMTKRKFMSGFLGGRLMNGCYDLLTHYYNSKITASETNLLTGIVQISDFISGRSLHGRIFTKADEILANRFTFLGYTQTMDPIAWHEPQSSLLWNLNLHYFEYALDLGLAQRLTVKDDQRYYEKFKALVLDWLAANPIGTGNGWNCYAVSIRMVSWMYASGLFETELATDIQFRDLLQFQIIKQELFLAHNLEYDIRGNHLLKNLKALWLAGQFFSGGLARRWMALAEKLLQTEMKRQILPDGGHFELSPMYHCQVMQDLLEIYLVSTRENNKPSPFADALLDNLVKMSGFIGNQLHPDGTMTLFGDSALGIAMDPKDLIMAIGNLAGYSFENHDDSLNDPYLFFIGGNRLITRMKQTRGNTAGLFTRPAMIHFSDSGYFVIRNGSEDFLVVDGGDFGPDTLPAHGHCDMSSYELSLAGERIVVDSGVLEYAAGKWRQYFRGTSAHNTVMVDDIEQAQCWGSFRVGKRARRISAGLALDEYQNPVFQGIIDLAPTASFKLLHTRKIIFIAKSLWLVMDFIHSDGLTTHSLKSFIHFEKHLNTAIERNGIYVYKDSALKAKILPLSVDEVRVIRGGKNIPRGYCAERFGQLEENDVAVLKKAVNSPKSFFGYVICPPARPDPQIEISGDKVIINGFHYKSLIR